MEQCILDSSKILSLHLYSTVGMILETLSLDSELNASLIQYINTMNMLELYANKA